MLPRRAAGRPEAAAAEPRVAQWAEIVPLQAVLRLGEVLPRVEVAPRVERHPEALPDAQRQLAPLA